MSATHARADFEDSACTVDAEDKVGAYTNWLGLMDRSLSASVSRGERSFERALNGRRSFDAADGSGRLSLKGQALLLARNVGMHMCAASRSQQPPAPIPARASTHRSRDRLSRPCAPWPLLAGTQTW